MTPEEKRDLRLKLDTLRFDVRNKIDDNINVEDWCIDCAGDKKFTGRSDVLADEIINLIDGDLFSDTEN